MEENGIVKYFTNIMETDKDVATVRAVIMTLLEVLKKDKSETVQELIVNLRAARDAMKITDYPTTAIISGSELFLRFITLTKLDMMSFEKCAEVMIQRGEYFIDQLAGCRDKVAEKALPFISDGCRILTHAKSRMVLLALKVAAKENKRFEVFVTTSSCDNSGVEMHEALQKEGIPSTLILDSAVGYVMEQVNFVMVGAEGVVESGGIINKGWGERFTLHPEANKSSIPTFTQLVQEAGRKAKSGWRSLTNTSYMAHMAYKAYMVHVGTFTIAVCAKAMNKDLYVLTESFKFVRYFPLSQQDLPNEYKYPASRIKEDMSKEHPRVDYTPPGYITLMFTDLGIFTAAAVSDELTKLYL